MTHTPTLATTQLSTGYGPDVIHSGLNLKVERGQLVCLIGPNGAGKSTLLRTLSGTQRPLSGSVQIAGKDAHRLSSLDRARLISLVLTERITSGLLTGYELVSMGRAPHTSWHGGLSPHDHQVIARAIQQCRGEDLAGKPLAEMSDGERQRLMLARALAQEPQLLILDEITAFLDVTRRMEMALLLRNIARQGEVSILLSTHDLDLAIRTADVVWLMPAAGEFHQGPPEELVLNGVLGSAFATEGIQFDATTGGFQTVQSDRPLVPVTGTGLRADWVRRAVARLELTSAHTSIEVDDSTFTVKQGDSTSTASSFADLLQKLQ